MKTTRVSILATFGFFLGTYAAAQPIEAVYSLDFEDGAAAKAAIDELFEDKDLKGSKVTLYAADFGVTNGASHVIVADFDNYDVRDELDRKRLESRGWAKYMLANQDSELIGADLAIVVADLGRPRHEAGYLVAFVMQVRDADAYLAALRDLNKAVPNPGVLRLVAMRSGSTQASHVVLVGASDFAAANRYLDKLFASDAFKTFAAKVGDIRTVQEVHMYRRAGTWGY